MSNHLIYHMNQNLFIRCIAPWLIISHTPFTPLWIQKDHLKHLAKRIETKANLASTLTISLI